MRVFSSCAILTALSLLGAAPLNVTRASATTSDDLYNRYFANVLDGPPCFARTYSDEHLKIHSTQRVRSIEIDLSKANSDGKPNMADRFELGFALMLKTSPEWYGQAASCRTGNTAFECFLEGDGGVFRLTPLANGGLRLETGENGLAFEGASDAIELSGKTGDDKTFDIASSKAECEAARAFFEGGNE
jgi:hypothetical protein